MFTALLSRFGNVNSRGNGFFKRTARRLSVFFLCVVVVPAFFSSGVHGADEAAEAGDSSLLRDSSAMEELDIRSDFLEMDFKTGKALFRGNVKVMDSRLVLTADKMDVRMSPEDRLEWIEASGNVVIQELRTEKRALAGKAVYDLQKGEIVLTEEPSLIQGGSSITGAEKIVYLRAEEKFRFERGEKSQIVIRAIDSGEAGSYMDSPGKPADGGDNE